MSYVAEVLFKALREMDKEADTIREGVRTGLRWYYAHLSEKGKDRTEDSWSWRLADFLVKRGVPAFSQVGYPLNGILFDDSVSRGACDLVMELRPARYLWLEMKGAWRYVLSLPERKPRKNPSYWKHLTHETPRDLEKLKVLGPPEASEIGLLLIGFDTVKDAMDEEVEYFSRKAGFTADGWQSFQDGWEDGIVKGSRARCWLWRRSVEG